MKAAILLILTLLLGLPVSSKGEQPQVKISQQRDGDVIQILAENLSDRSLTITVQIADIHNAKSEGWPTKAVKRCLPGDRIMMTALIQTAGAPPATFTCTVSTSDDAPTSQPVVRATPAPAMPPSGSRVPADAPKKDVPVRLQPVDPAFGYRLPFEHGTSHNVSQGYNGRASHQGAYALDFDMPEGTAICAAREGVVIELEKTRPVQSSDSTIGNFVAIKHADGTVALYAQLARDGVSVAVGQHVLTGDVIGRSGTTGHSNGPHLHFEVGALPECIGVTEKGIRGTIPVVFDIYGATKVTLVVGTTYKAE